MLLHLGGAAIHKLGRPVVEEGPPYTYQSLKQALKAHFEPLANPDYERFLLRQARQFPHESVGAFYARLKDLARTCTLVDVEDEVGEALLRRKDRNGKMPQKRGAKERHIRVGNMVLVKCRKGGSKFVLPFEKDPWMVSDVKSTMISAKRGSELITRNIYFYKKVHAPDFQVPIDISSCDIIDQDYDDIGLQDPCLETHDAFSGRVMCPDMQSPDDNVVLDHGTCQSMPNSGNHLVMEPTTSGPGVAGSVTSNLGDGPYNLRPRPQYSTRLHGFVLN
ncbi:hypothetical protein NDU88_005388 [Pleurodeles waltl]|uniref:Retrotransposon gag domain-containing protein n=1 Tax=Pleurodeles waltl TaxID=8319 RepID=A0AAV7SLM7_PLEWA|nr:hypothetical protein NDU88_005388 [Pleurodeles waltl]